MDVKIPASYFVTGSKLMIDFTWRDKRSRAADATLRKEVGRQQLTARLLIKLQTVWYWCEDRHVDQQSRGRNREVDPRKQSQLVFDRGQRQTKQRRKDSLFNKRAAEHPHAKNKKNL